MKLNQSQMMIGGGVLLLIAAAWAAKSLFGVTAQSAARNVAEGAVGAAAGAAVGVLAGVNDAIGIPRTSDIVTWANSGSNPLQPVGAWVGGTIYDLTHW